MKAIGIKINIQNYDANTFFGTNLPTGTFQIAEFAWVSTPFVSGNQSIYCSYTNAMQCADNWNHCANVEVDTAMCQRLSAAELAKEITDYNEADATCGRTWSRCRCTRSRSSTPGPTPKGVLPNTSSVGVTWNAETGRSARSQSLNVQGGVGHFGSALPNVSVHTRIRHARLRH